MVLNGNGMAKNKHSEQNAGAPAPGGNKYLGIMVAFIAAFVLAFALAWAVFSAKTPPPVAGPATAKPAEPPARTLSNDDLKPFFAAVEARNFPDMDRLGYALFMPGTIIPDSKSVLADYATNSFPPHLVYAIFTRVAPDRVSRVILTMDESDTVVSFMAEEMEIQK